MARSRAHLWVGTSGYQYDHWRGLFYPQGLAKRRWFEHFASRFSTVEINNGGNYDGDYAPEALQREAGWIGGELAAGRDVYAYFNNDLSGHAISNALDLRGYVGGVAGQA